MYDPHNVRSMRPLALARLIAETILVNTIILGATLQLLHLL